MHYARRGRSSLVGELARAGAYRTMGCRCGVSQWRRFNGVAQGYAADRALAAVGDTASSTRSSTPVNSTALATDTATPSILGVRDRAARSRRGWPGCRRPRQLCESSFLHARFFAPSHLRSRPRQFAHRAGQHVRARSRRNALQADGLSTAFMVLGPERSLALAATLPGVGRAADRKEWPKLADAGSCRRWRAPEI